MSAGSTGPVPSAMGRFEIVGEIATGGMAQVLLARARGIERFQKVVALKRILPHVARDPDFIRMFLEEARLAAQLDHPNVVQVHDIGQEGGEYFFTMEYVHGETLLAILREGAAAGDELPLALAVFIASEVAAGLHHAHERVGFEGKRLELIHRDMSPSNVLVSFEGAVKVADFGIAKAAESAHKTTSGARKGKTAYMSPEQCTGNALDRRTDIWSLGLMLYEMTTGQRPFRGTTQFTLMEQIVRGTPAPPGELVPGYPAALEAVVLRALARDREDRPATALELRESLVAVARELDERVSATELGAYVQGLFGARPLPWEGEGLKPLSDATDGTANAPAELAPTKVIPTTGRRSALPWLIAGTAAAGITAALLWPGPTPGPAPADEPRPGAEPPPVGEPASPSNPPSRPQAESEPAQVGEPVPGRESHPEAEPLAQPQPLPTAEPKAPPKSNSNSNSKPRPNPNRDPAAKTTPRPKSKPGPRPKSKPDTNPTLPETKSDRGGLFDEFVDDG